MQDVEGLLQVRVMLLTEEHPCELETAVVFESPLVLSHPDFDVAMAQVPEGEIARLFGVVQRVAFGQLDHYLILFRPGVMKVDVVLAPAGREQRTDAFLEEGRLQEET